MAKIIEFFGASGVGKTTTYNEVKSRWSTNLKWIPGEHLYPKKKISSGNVVKYIIKYICMRNETVDTGKMLKARDRFVQQHYDFVEKCIKGIYCRAVEHDESFQYIVMRLNILDKLFQKVQVITEYESNRYALIDEGMIQHMGYALRDDSISHECIDLYTSYEMLFEKCPIPEGVIFINTDPAIIAHRVYHRKKKLFKYKNLTETEIRSHVKRWSEDRVKRLNYLRNNGVKILDLDGRDNVRENTQLVFNFLQEL